MCGDSLVMRVFRAVLFGLAGVLAATSTNATPLTFYYDQASWLAAAAALQIGTYSSGSGETDQLRTVQYPGPQTIGTSTVTTSIPNGGFSSVGPIDFSYPTSCSPGCTVTRPTNINISLTSPILGFEANLSLADSLGVITLNSQLISPAPTYNGFFGVIGPLSSIDFHFSGSITDSPESLNLSNIQVLTVNEPPSLMLVLNGGVLLLLLAPYISGNSGHNSSRRRQLS